jgi:hypothetical protein
MGLFNKTPKVNPFQETLKDLTIVFSAMNTPDHPSFDELNQPLEIWNLSRNAKDWRDRAAKEKVYGYAAIFSTIHWRTFLKGRIPEISGQVLFHEQLTNYGCINLDFLYSDLHYIELGVRSFGVSPEEYEECKEFVELYKTLVVKYVYEQEKLIEEKNLVPVKDFGTGKTTFINTEVLIQKLEPR